MTHRRARISSLGLYVPERELTNADLEKLVDTNDEWIRTRTGIEKRHIAEPGTPSSELAIHACRQALERRGLPAAEVDLIIVATVTPDYAFPSTACLVQDALGAKAAAAFDLSAGCSGFVYGMALAADLIAAGRYGCALVVGAETLSRVTDYTDRGTCILFGDGAGAVVLKASDTPGGVLSSQLGADGSGGELLILPGGGSVHPATSETVTRRLHFLQMQGREVFRFATRIMADASRQVLDQAELQIEDVSLFVPHQANDRILQAAARGLGVSEERMFSNLARYGNTSSASIPIALCEAIDQGKVKRDDLVVCVGFGAGLTWAAAAVRWTMPLPAPTPSRRTTVQRSLRYRWARMRSLWWRLWRRIDARLFHILYDREGKRKRRRRND